VLYLDGVLLMELVLDAEGNAARRLIDTSLTVADAHRAYHDMLGQLVRILSCDMIHGDLSPYNVLWGAAGPTIIDFPQIISASHNSSSEQFFLRDADNILGHFARVDRSLLARRGDPREIWNAYRRRELSPDFKPTGHARPFVPQRAAMPDGPRPPHRPDSRPAHPGARPHGGTGRPPQASAGGARRAMHMPEVIVRHAPAAATPAQTQTQTQKPADPTTPAEPGERSPRRRRRRRR
jgi:RIO kinase 1